MASVVAGPVILGALFVPAAMGIGGTGADGVVFAALVDLSTVPLELEAATVHWKAAGVYTSAEVSVYLAEVVGAAVVTAVPTATPLR
jgi:hypothetical protein